MKIFIVLIKYRFSYQQCSFVLMDALQFTLKGTQFILQLGRIGSGFELCENRLCYVIITLRTSSLMILQSRSTNFLISSESSSSNFSAAIILILFFHKVSPLSCDVVFPTHDSKFPHCNAKSPIYFMKYVRTGPGPGLPSILPFRQDLLFDGLLAFHLIFDLWTFNRVNNINFNAKDL